MIEGLEEGFEGLYEEDDAVLRDILLLHGIIFDNPYAIEEETE